MGASDCGQNSHGQRRIRLARSMERDGNLWAVRFVEKRKTLRRDLAILQGGYLDEDSAMGQEEFLPDYPTDVQ